MRRKPYKAPTQSSADVVEANYKASQYYSMRDQGARKPGSIARSMNFASPSNTTSSDPANISFNDYNRGRSVTLEQAKRAKRTVRSTPSVGRTIEINPERDADFGRAVRALDIQCAVNRVRSDQARQRYHERGGAKRKRLKSERWRKLFKASFQAAVGRVKEMRRKGW